MIILLICLSIIALVVGHKMQKADSWRISDAGDIIQISATVVLVVMMVIGIILSIIASSLARNEEKICYLQEQNAAIDTEVQEMVSTYTTHEENVYINLKSQSATTLVNLYPQLSSSELVKTQMSIYIDNKKEIKRLKLESIDGSVLRWWLYFGK